MWLRVFLPGFIAQVLKHPKHTPSDIAIPTLVFSWVTYVTHQPTQTPANIPFGLLLPSWVTYVTHQPTLIPTDIPLECCYLHELHM